jgi:hypothetical protein
VSPASDFVQQMVQKEGVFSVFLRENILLHLLV